MSLWNCKHLGQLLIYVKPSLFFVDVCSRNMAKEYVYNVNKKDN